MLDEFSPLNVAIVFTEVVWIVVVVVGAVGGHVRETQLQFGDAFEQSCWLLSIPEIHSSFFLTRQLASSDDCKLLNGIDETKVRQKASAHQNAIELNGGTDPVS